MTSEANDSTEPLTIEKAILERKSLYDQIQAAVDQMSLQRERLRERIVPTTRRWEQSRPHSIEKESEFLILHNVFLDLVKTMGESQRRSNLSMKAVPAASPRLSIVRKHSTSSKALHHEENVIDILRSELNGGIDERSRILERLDALVHEIEAFVEAEVAT